MIGYSTFEEEAMNDKDQRPIDLPDDRDNFLEWAVSVDEGVPSVGGLAARSGIIKASQGADEGDFRNLRGVASARKLQDLAGLIARRDSRLSRAAARLATRSAPTAQLDPEGRDALEEFVKALAEATD
jgi:hypothetical protein